MRALCLAALALAAACTKSNSDVCCATPQQCAQLGVSDLRPCAAGQACSSDNACVAAECSTSADCASSAGPICLRGLCGAACEVDPDCTGLAGRPYCAVDQTCVGCERDDQCGAATPICDGSAHACRGCDRDDECAGGVCFDADATCVADANALFVDENSGIDTGTCPRAAPCLTLAYAVSKVAAGRHLVEVLSGTTSVASTIALTTTVQIDGSDATIRGTHAGPLFAISGNGVVSMSSVRLVPLDGTAVTVSGGTSSLSLFSAHVTGLVTVTNGTVNADRTAFMTASSPAQAISCMGGTVAVVRSQVVDTHVDATNCQVTVQRTRFESSESGSVIASGGSIAIENNLIIESLGGADSMSIGSVGAGSTVRFNTFVNTTTTASDGVALTCDATLAVSSNIFAYRSAHPHGTSNCKARYSLYDTDAVAAQTSGTGNKAGDASGFFVDRTAKDFHLAAGSPARAAAEPGLPTTDDFDGTARPTPAGTVPDMGAFEAP